MNDDSSSAPLHIPPQPIRTQQVEHDHNDQQVQLDPATATGVCDVDRDEESHHQRREEIVNVMSASEGCIGREVKSSVVADHYFNDEEEWSIADGQRTAGEEELQRLKMIAAEDAVVEGNSHHNTTTTTSLSSSPETSPLCVSPLLDPSRWLYAPCSPPSPSVAARSQHAGNTLRPETIITSTSSSPPSQIVPLTLGSLDRYFTWVATTKPTTEIMQPAVDLEDTSAKRMSTTDIFPSLTIVLRNKCGRSIQYSCPPPQYSATTQGNFSLESTTNCQLQRQKQQQNRLPIRCAQRSSSVADDDEEEDSSPEAQLQWAARIDVYGDFHITKH